VDSDASRGVRRLALLCRQLEAVHRKKAQLLLERNAVLAQLDESGVARTQLAKVTGLTPGRITQLLERQSVAVPKSATK
jgi:hypothetical protein